MADQKNTKVDELTSFLQNKSFIWGPEPEIYDGGIAGFYTYAPLGKLLKNNIENAIRTTFNQNDFWEVECPIVMPEEVWVASGHVGGFTDPLIKDEKGNIFRVDKLIEEWCMKNDVDFNSLKIDGATDEHILNVIAEKKIAAPNGLKLVPEIKEHNLMMKTTVGVDKVAYNRPETATTTYLPFPRYLNFFRDKLPFGVFQIGKAFRNEISPRQSVLRGREFTQAEGQLFIFEDQKNNFEKFNDVKDVELPLWDYKQQDANEEVKPITLAAAIDKGVLKNQAYAWSLHLGYMLFRNMGIPAERIRFRQHNLDERAFYADDAWDVEIKLDTFGWTETCGIHDRTTYDLSQHEKHSKKQLNATRDDGSKEKPHVIEIAFGTDRPTFAMLDISYEKKEVGAGKPKLTLPANIAPVKVSVFPLVKKDPVLSIAKDLYAELKDNFVARFDMSGAIGKRYLREDEAGTPYCITVDFDGVEDNTVTIRDRDSEEQKRISRDNIVETLRNLISGKVKFDSL